MSFKTHVHFQLSIPFKWSIDNMIKYKPFPLRSDSSVNQDKEFEVEVRRGKEKKVKSLFKGMLG